MPYQARGNPFPITDSEQRGKSSNQKMKRWTPQEIEQLLDLFPKSSKRSLVSTFGRSWELIRQKYKLLTKCNMKEVRKGLK